MGGGGGSKKWQQRKKVTRITWMAPSTLAIFYSQSKDIAVKR